MILRAKEGDLSMDLETKLLRDTKLFNLPEKPTDDYQNTDSITDHSFRLSDSNLFLHNFILI